MFGPPLKYEPEFLQAAKDIDNRVEHTLPEHARALSRALFAQIRRQAQRHEFSTEAVLSPDLNEVDGGLAGRATQ